MINWDLYKGSKLERSKKAYEEFCELLERENYKLIGNYVNNGNKIELECNKSHRYFVQPRNFKSGNRCPICSGNHQETAKLNFIKQVESENYKVIGKYVNNYTKIELECNKGHRYFVQPNNFKSGNRCPVCSGLDSDVAKLDFIKQVEKEGYKLIGEYKNTMTKIELECDKGHRYFVRPNDFKKNCSRCPICPSKKSETAKLDFINKVKNEGYRLIGEYVNNGTKVELECNKYHRYFVIPNNFKKGHRCPICGGNNPKQAKLDFIKQVEKEGYKVLGKYINASTKIELQCNKSHRYFVQPNNFKNGQRCPYCSTISHGEILTKKILDEYNCKYESQKKFDGLIGLGGGQLSYDFFVDNYLLIEIQGEQHYKPKELFGGEEKFKQQQEHDRRKREFAKENDYKLLEIPYFSVRDLDKLEKILREKIEDYKHIPPKAS